MTVKAICIYKIENQLELTGSPNKHGRFLKLCTLKVDQSIRGRRIGERLLFTAMNRAYQDTCEGVFVHTRESKQQSLVGLLEDFGFSNIGPYKTDAVYYKNVNPSSEYGEISPLQYVECYYPHFVNDDRVAKYIVPIQPRFHERHFPDQSALSDGLFQDDQFLLSPCGNAVKKAYICNSNTQQIAEGDLLLFYRSNDRCSVQVCGVVEKVVRTRDADLALTIVSKRTVYTREEVRSMMAGGRDALILLFRYIVPELEVRQLDLHNAGVKGSIQTIRRISNDQYRMLLKVTK